MKCCTFLEFAMKKWYDKTTKVKGVGGIMRGALIETEARTILNQGKTQGISETKRLTALRMLKMGKLTIEEIAECSELSVAEVEQLKELQTV